MSAGFFLFISYTVFSLLPEVDLFIQKSKIRSKKILIIFLIISIVIMSIGHGIFVGKVGAILVIAGLMVWILFMSWFLIKFLSWNRIQK